MSLAELMKATKSQLQTDLGTYFSITLNDYYVDIMPDDRPKPTSGPWFVAIHGESWSPGNRDPNLAIEEVYGMGCTVTLRQSAIPRDEVGENLYIEATTSLEKICRQIMVSVHLNAAIRTTANAAITGDDKIVEYFRWSGTEAKPRIVSGDWFFSNRPDVDTGYVMRVDFERATRYQSLTNME